ncbi:MAG: hypothetical protein B7X58_09005 [Marinobacter sp. 34-60-7]|nr:MAG: hypothetical protein B7X58_09005 [Marinobacter sp. 34-60-7]
MLRAFVVAGLLLAVGVAGFLGYSEFLAPGGRGAEPAASTCDLLAAPCQWQTDEGTWQVALARQEESGQGTTFELTVTAPKPPDRFIAVLRGQSMYMGEYPVPLVRETTNGYRARFTAPVCSVSSDGMVWQLVLQDGQQALENVPHTLVFRTRT